MISIRDSGLPPSPTLILYTIASRTDLKGKSWPSITTIANDARLHRATVARWLPILRDAGYIEIAKAPGYSNRYHLTLDPSHHATTTRRTMRPEELKKKMRNQKFTCWLCKTAPIYDTASDTGLCLPCWGKRNRIARPHVL